MFGLSEREKGGHVLGARLLVPYSIPLRIGFVSNRRHFDDLLDRNVVIHQHHSLTCRKPVTHDGFEKISYASEENLKG